MRTKPGITRKLGVVAITAAMLAVAGCGGDQDANAGDDATSPLKKYLGYSPLDTNTGRGQGVQAVSVQGSNDTLIATPGMPMGGQNSEEQTAQNRKVENLIATCMEEQGFEYVPFVPDTEDKSPLDKAYDLPPDKFAERWGYGIATTMDEMITEGPDQDENPNEAITEKLSESARKAYDVALYGENGGRLETFESAPRRAEGGRAGSPEEGAPGCSQKASEKVFGDMDANIEEFSSFQPLFEDVHALSERLERDPEVVKANAGWSDCMADAGHTGLDSPQDARSRIDAEFSEAMQQGGDPMDPDKQVGNPPGLDKIAEKEIELATADFECAEKGLNDVRAEAAKKLEAEFVEDNKAELERYRDYRTEQQGKSDGSDDQESGN